MSSLVRDYEGRREKSNGHFTMMLSQSYKKRSTFQNTLNTLFSLENVLPLFYSPGSVNYTLQALNFRRPESSISLIPSPAGYQIPLILSTKYISVCFSSSSSNSGPHHLSQTHYLTMGMSYYPWVRVFVSL